MTETVFNVDIQPSNGFGEFKNEVFTIKVEAETYDSAARRGVRKAVSRAIDWNADHPGAAKRPEFNEGYRAVGVRLADAPAPAAPAAEVAGPQGSGKVVLTLEVIGAQVIVHGGKS
ncbi:hypothetical protein [Nocardia pseudovaccinii]|uniref:hypothetical protein n=1 Tax=Nocardia pseudovaccinii TaxID=189540 RepID=UPI000AB562D7|nr:hypothetical protein [Nocardia pseudovaccinii]